MILEYDEMHVTLAPAGTQYVGRLQCSMHQHHPRQSVLPQPSARLRRGCQLDARLADRVGRRCDDRRFLGFLAIGMRSRAMVCRLRQSVARVGQ